MDWNLAEPDQIRHNLNLIFILNDPSAQVLHSDSQQHESQQPMIEPMLEPPSTFKDKCQEVDSANANELVTIPTRERYPGVKSKLNFRR